MCHVGDVSGGSILNTVKEGNNKFSTENSEPCTLYFVNRNYVIKMYTILTSRAFVR